MTSRRKFMGMIGAVAAAVGLNQSFASAHALQATPNPKPYENPLKLTVVERVVWDGNALHQISRVVTFDTSGMVKSISEQTRSIIDTAMAVE